MNDESSAVLTLNSGSSSLKFALYRLGAAEALGLSGAIQRIGLSAGQFRARDANGKSLAEQQGDFRNHDAALAALFAWLKNRPEAAQIGAVGHRVVHGGTEYAQPRRVDPELIAALKRLIPFAPEHLPHEIAAIESVGRAYPALPQVACFDTAFHRQMPAVAQRYPLPRRFGAEGVLRYGFHGLSYEYIVGELRRTAGERAGGRLIVAHLGNGASMAAVRDGQSLDTTMGFTPAGGLIMSTRSGDLDPGALLYLLREKGLSVNDVQKMVHEQSGLLGISEISSDMSDLLARQGQDPRAAEAIESFCYQAKKLLAGLAAVLGGLDTLVFTAGIGENAPAIRGRICGDLEFLGIRLDGVRNEANEAVISADGSPVTVRVMKTNEELMIARHTDNLLRRK